MMKKERLDKVLVNRELVKSRERAKSLIMAGNVFVDGVKLTKVGNLIDENAKIELKGESLPYVSRGGLKLESAIKQFNIEVKDKICMDVGASTGGFTDCLLQNGAKLVYAIDVGYGQLDWKLRKDKRVISIERTNIRYFNKDDFLDIIRNNYEQLSNLQISDALPSFSTQKLGGQQLLPRTTESPVCKDGDEWEWFSRRVLPKSHACKGVVRGLPELVTIDVSFISLEKVLPKIYEITKPQAEIIALIKPQFEAGREKVAKGGVVKDKDIHKQVIEKIKKFSITIGLKEAGVIPSPITGPAGNIEYLIYLKKE